MATITEKILSGHLVEGAVEGKLPKAGSEIGVKIDQTLTQDATGTMAYLEWEALGMPRVKTELSVSYVDHNTLQTDFMNADDHDYLRTVAAKYGILYSRPGNGICHQVHLERFARPGKTLLGSDSHTPTAGGVCSLAIGAGGLDVALAMGGGSFHLNMPKVVGVKLIGELKPWVSAKDVILELLRRTDVKGGVGKVFEYFGPGVRTLSIPERATITNMGAETGATTSIFPSDNVTKKYLESEGRGDQWVEMKPDSASDYKERIEIDLSTIEPLVAKPHSPGNVGKVSELEGTKVNQVIIGSCTNSSYRDLMVAAAVLKGKTVHPNVSFAILPGSRQVYKMIADNGALADLIAAGARILESACGPCIGMGLAPRSGGVTVRTFNRNFEGRCGTADAKAYLVSPETAAAIALTGTFTDPRKLGEYPKIKAAKVEVDDSMIIPPPEPEEPDSPSPPSPFEIMRPSGTSSRWNSNSIEIIRGPNIKPLPDLKPLENSLNKEVLLKVGDNITTDHIMPAGAKILPLRSNVPAISEFVFSKVDPAFPKRAKEKGGGFVVGGENYGQGSSREHAAIAPLYLGVRAVIAKSWARIHKDNLMNWGIVPLTFVNAADYEKIVQGDVLEMLHIRDELKAGKEVTLKNKAGEFKAKCELSPRAIEILLEGGLIPYTKKRSR